MGAEIKQGISASTKRFVQKYILRSHALSCKLTIVGGNISKLFYDQA